jgi:glutamate-1-semialdehyde 2,1-aminomutase
VAAGLATLRRLDDDAYARLGALTDRLADGLRDLAREHNLNVAAAPGLVTLFFSALPVRNFEESKATDGDRHAAFYRAMLDRGIWLPPSRFEAWFVSLAQDEIQIDRTLMAASEALAATDPRKAIG